MQFYLELFFNQSMSESDRFEIYIIIRFISYNFFI